MFGADSDEALALVLPDWTQKSAKPVPFAIAGTNAWLGYVSEHVTITCGDNHVFIPTSKINWGGGE